ncbi:MAG TPA: hypothetical protein VFT29_20185 [Gemmatimonadaceae bacterium]|nr:hypothetical protein [Gemmatimonadaceae bacterium]
MQQLPKALAVMLCIGLAGCGGTAITRESFIPIPDHAPRPTPNPDLRGTTRAAARISPAEQFEILGELVRRFYRPMMQQARWVDPQPLANQRTRQADSAMQVNEDWALAIVEAARVPRVCPLNDGNTRCQGLAGFVLRFSPPYAVGAAESSADSAIVYVRHTPVRGGGVSGEMEFFFARRQGAWRMVSKRTMPEVVSAGAPRSSVVDPQESVNALLAADRAFAAAAKVTDLVTALSNMFVSNVVMQAPGAHARGLEAARQSLSANADNKRSRVEWTPVRGGVSSDGEHGFTVGYMTITRPDGTTLPAKYVAYWVKGDAGWRVAAYKRVPSASGTVSLAAQAPWLPVRALPQGDSAAVHRYADELSLAEHAFSKDAAPMGLGPAFEKWGAPDAVNTGGASSPEFVRGPQAIAKLVGAGLATGSGINWAPEQVIVASTGDLGVSIGTIHVTTPASADKAASTRDIPFFTIWRRAYPGDPWRYVAE